jgi:hypothetical protein
MSDDAQTTTVSAEAGADQVTTDKIEVDDLEQMFADGADAGGQRRRWGLLMFTPPEVDET